MTSPDSEQLEPRGRQTIWLTTVRYLAICSVFGILVPWYVTIAHELGTERAEFLIPLYFAPLWAPYLWIFLRLISTANGRAKKKAFALGIGWGAMGFLLFGAVFLLIIPTVDYAGNGRDVAVVFGGLALLQLSLVAASIKAYLSMKTEPETTAPYSGDSASRVVSL